ncbi:VOC family protein, partial [Nocardiopsis alba]|uniref:VOC family protein n=1 Tax=Nocardiopsis alba TaxID=53437 RepID=UPI0033D9F187
GVAATQIGVGSRVFSYAVEGRVGYVINPEIVAEAFGWRFNDYGPMYAGIRSPDGESEVGGLNPGGEVRGGGPLVLLYSEDLDRTVEAVERAGGRVLKGPYAFPGGRRFHFADPSGNELGVYADA